MHLPLAEIDRPRQGLTHQGRVSSASPFPQPLLWHSPYDSVHMHGPDPLAASAHGRMRPGMARLQSDTNANLLQWRYSHKYSNNDKCPLGQTLILEKKCLKQPFGST